MDQLDTRNMVEHFLEQFRKWMDVLRTACITPKEREQVLCTFVGWLICNGYTRRLKITATIRENWYSWIGGKETSTEAPITGRSWV